MTVYIGDGHGRDNTTVGVDDPGAVYGKRTEAAFVRTLVPAIVQYLEPVIDVRLIPDSGTLDSRITWLMERATPDDWAFHIHMNSGGGTGTEVVYDDQKEDQRDEAETILKTICTKTGLKNRGVKRDTETPRHYLGFVSRPSCKAFIIECGFLDNDADCATLTQKGAKAIADSILTALNMAKKLSPEQQAAWDRMKAISVFSDFTKVDTVLDTQTFAVLASRLIDAIKRGA